MTSTTIISVIVDAITEFVTGLGSAFLSAFQTVFMIETTDGNFSGINDLGIFLLVMAGASLAYGIVRWVTGLFRREV